MNIIKKLRASIRLNEAVVQADKAHEETGERYYVMPNGKSGKLIIMDRFNFRKLKQKGYLSRSTFVNDLERECFYCTPYKNGSGALPEFTQKKKKVMGSRYDAKQGIDGIVTLTNDPLAIDNIRKIKAGDRVVCNDDGNSGTVLAVDDDNYGCTVLFDDTLETWIECDQLSKE